MGNWRKITSDKFILDIVQQCHLEFDNDIKPSQLILPFQMCFDKIQEKEIDTEIDNLLRLGVIKQVNFDKDQYISSIFTVHEKDTKEQRMILNLRELNKFITPHHFKMDTFEMALKLVKQDCYFGSIDLRHAYYSVSIAEEDKKYLRFIWKEFFFQYSCLPNGLTSAPRLFTKLMKPVFATLRQYDYKHAGYVDDSRLIGDTEEECESNIKDTDTLY